VAAPTLWRVFPWDPRAGPGAPFSPSHLPPQSGQGRFDLPPRAGASTWYFAEHPDHAVAERIQDLRNRTLFEEALFERGRRLALVSVHVGGEVGPVDLCDPVQLARRDIAPDRLAYRDPEVTRGIAADLHADPHVTGLRWWSAFFGEWHTVALFSDRVRAADLVFGEPDPLHLDTPAVMAAAAALAIEV
jgi:hypothetical protein